MLGLEFATLSGQPLALPLTAAFTVAAVEVVWRLSRAVPHTKRGKLGFVVAILYENEEHAKRIRADFVQTLPAC